MAKITRDYEYSKENLLEIAREELAKSLVHGAEVQNGANRRRDHGLAERIKAIGLLADDLAVESGGGLVRQAVFLRGRRG